MSVLARSLNSAFGRRPDIICRSRPLRLVVAVAVIASTLVGPGVPSADAAVPTGFTKELVTSDVPLPISIRFLPDGTSLVSDKSGLLYRVDATTLPASTELFLDLSNIQSGAERGLIDFAIDPDYADNGKFYLYYSPGTPANFRISSFTNAATPALRLASETVLWTDPSGYTSCCHYGGGLDIGPDGKLWLTVGDKFDGAKAQDLSTSEGKVIRINTDGSIPDGTDGWAANPYVGPGDDALDEVWARGLRNPFRARWDLPTGRFFIGEVGGNSRSAWEDLHVGGLDDAGTNYGWPNCEGLPPHTDFPDCDDTAHEDPVFAYAHNTVGGSGSITGGVVYRAGVYPAEYDGAYFYGDYAREIVHYLTFDSAGNPTDHVFDDDAGLVVGMSVGLDGRLYTTHLTGEVYRYTFNGGPNQAPSATNVSASPSPVGVGQTVTFGATIVDPDSNPLDYTWNFGDGNTTAGTGGPGAVQTTHTYASEGVFDVTLSVDDGTSQATSVPIVVQVGTPPTAAITTPADGSSFVAGQSIDFSGPPPGPGETYDWTVVFTHNTHLHPVVDGLGGQSGSFDISSSGHDYTSDTGYRIILKVTNSFGLFSETSVDIGPDKTDVTIESMPSGITIDVDGVPRVTPLTLDTLKQFEHELIAEPSRCIGGTVHDFVSWSNGQPATHTYTVPNTAQTLTANYTDTSEPCSATVPVTSGLAMRLTANEGVTASGADVVSNWSDASGNDNDVIPVGSGPTRVPGALNGNDIVSFDGVDDSLGRTGFVGLPTGDSDRTIFMVVRYDSNGWGGFTYGQHSCNKAFGLGVAKNGALAVQGWCNDVSAAVAGPGSGWMSQAVIYEAGAGSLYRDGALIEAFESAYATGTTEIRIGSELDDSPFLDMDLAEVLVYDRALNESERTAVEDWIQATYLNGPTVVGPDIDLHSPVDGQLLSAAEIDVDWSVASGSAAGDSVEVTLDDGPAVTGSLTGTHTFTGVPPGNHTVRVRVVDSGSTPYENPEATESAVVTISSTTSVPQVPVLSGLVGDFGGGENLVADGTAVSGWLDRSGFGNDLTLGGGGPTLGVVTPTGVPAVSFDGTGDKLQRSTALVGLPAGAADRSMFVVARYNAKKWGGVAYGDNVSRQAFGLGVNGSGKLFHNGWNYNTSTAEPGVGAGWTVHSAVLSGNVLRQFEVTDQIGVSNRTFETNPVRLVLGNDLGTNDVDVDIAAVLIYDRALTPAEHSQVANFLNNSYIAGGGTDTTAPVVTLAGQSSMTVGQDSPWTEPGYSAVDDIDGDITAAVAVGGDVVDTATIGTYTITYDVSDAAGNPAEQVIRSVTVESSGTDTTPPVIALNGGAVVSLAKDSVWSDPGFTASDDTDGDITGSVVVGGDAVDAATVGTYVVTYDVSDAAGNSAVRLTRTVSVQNPAPPVPVTADLVLNLGSETIVSSNGDASGWTDASPSGNSLTSVGGDPSIGTVTPTGAATVSFDGGGDKLERVGTADLPTDNDDRSVFVVARYHSGRWGGAFFGNASTKQAFGLGVDKSGRLYVGGWGYNNSTGTLATGGGWVVHSALHRSGVLTQYDLGTAISTASRTYETDPQRLVLGNDLGASYVDMDVAAVLIYDRALTPAEHAQVVAHLDDLYLT